MASKSAQRLGVKDGNAEYGKIEKNLREWENIKQLNAIDISLARHRVP